MEWSFAPFDKDLVKMFKIKIPHFNQVIYKNCKWACQSCLTVGPGNPAIRLGATWLDERSTQFAAGI
jgi:hypothetical protein